MSFAAHASLPRTRSLHRRRPQRLWWIAISVAVLTNLGLVIVLSQVSRLHPAAPEPPLTVRSLRQLADPEPPPPPPDRPVDTELPQPDASTPLALPTLDLPAVSTSPLSLPTLGTPDATFDLPLSFPDFAAIGPPGDGPPIVAPAAPTGAPAFDTPAQREGTFDLDRYYPRAARLRGVTGSTRVRITISVEGRVTGVEILDSTPAGIFEQAAERLASSLRFRPATLAGKPTASVQDTTISWTIK